MPKIKVEPHPKQILTYSSQVIQYTLVSSPKDGRKQCTTLASCRDNLHGRVRDHIRKRQGLEGIESIDMSKLRLLLVISSKKDEDLKEFKEKLFSGKRLLNFYERLAGWKESKITTVDYDKGRNAWLMTGPKGWMQHPQLLSIVTLILRVAARYGPVKFKNNGDIEKFYDKVANPSQNYTNSDSGYIYSCKDKLYTIMKNHKKLFIDDLDEAYVTDNNQSLGWGGGIVALCRFSVNGKNKALQTRLEKEMKKR